MTRPTPTSTDHLVRPQADGSDTDCLVALAELRWGIPTMPASTARLGKVVLSPVEQEIAPWIEPAALDHPNLHAIQASLARWPEAWDGFQRFVTTFWPLEQPGMCGRGCTSGHTVKDGQRIVYVTIYDVEGCREGLLHEWAHLRLEAMGIDLETHDGVFLSTDHVPRYVSPIRKDVLRPMSAVVHGFYAWVLMSAGDLVAAEHGDLDQVVDFFRTNVCKLEEGLLTLEQHSPWKALGQPFGDELMAWGRELVDRMWAFIPDHQQTVRANHRAWVESQPVSWSPVYGAASVGALQ